MPFTTRTITHTFSNADGTACSGSVTFNLTQRMTNGTSTLVPASEVTGTLNAGGALSVVLTSNTDTGTVPTGAAWRVTFRLAGCDIEQFYITVPPGPGTTDLGSLLPAAEQVA